MSKRASRRRHRRQRHNSSSSSSAAKPPQILLVPPPPWLRGVVEVAVILDQSALIIIAIATAKERHLLRQNRKPDPRSVTRVKETGIIDLVVAVHRIVNPAVKTTSQDLSAPDLEITMTIGVQTKDRPSLNRLLPPHPSSTMANRV